MLYKYKILDNLIIYVFNYQIFIFLWSVLIFGHQLIIPRL